MAATVWKELKQIEFSDEKTPKIRQKILLGRNHQTILKISTEKFER